MIDDCPYLSMKQSNDSDLFRSVSCLVLQKACIHGFFEGNQSQFMKRTFDWRMTKHEFYHSMESIPELFNILIGKSQRLFSVLELEESASSDTSAASMSYKFMT